MKHFKQHFCFVLASIALILGSDNVTAQNWITVTFDNKDQVMDIPFQRVRIKPSDTQAFLFPKDFCVFFTEIIDGKESGYYAAHSTNGYVLNGSKKNKIKIDQMYRVQGGWYEYDFGRTLYIRQVGSFVKSEGSYHPIMIESLEGSIPTTPAQATQGTTQNTQSSLLTEKPEGLVRSLLGHDEWPTLPISTLTKVELTKIQRGNKENPYYEDLLRLTYANGDVIEIKKENEYSPTRFIRGTIHCEGVVAEFRAKPDSNLFSWTSDTRLTYDNGTIYDGTVKETGGYEEVKDEVLYCSKLTPWTGIYTYSNGQQEKIYDGQTEREREQKAAKAKQEKEQQEKAHYNKMCQRYGKKYWDTFCNTYRPIVGAPESLILEHFHGRLEYENQQAKKYILTGVTTGNSYLTYSQMKSVYRMVNFTSLTVWVKNGRVTSVHVWY